MTQFEHTFNLMKKPWSITIYLVLIILAFNCIDKPLATYFHQFDLRANLYPLNYLTELGKSSVYVILFILITLYFRYIAANPKYEARSWFLLGCIIIPNLVCLVLKVILGRARPELLFTINAFGFYWFKTKALYWSFPSGHTTTIVGLASGLGVLFPKYFYAFLAMAFLVILTRVLLYYHYVSDVMTAFYLSILVVGMLTRCTLVKRKVFSS